MARDKLSTAKMNEHRATIDSLAQLRKFDEAAREADRIAVSLELDLCSDEQAREFRELAHRWAERAKFEDEQRNA